MVVEKYVRKTERIFNNRYNIFVKFLLTIDPGVIIFLKNFNLFWLGPNGSQLFFYKPNYIQGGDSNDMYNH